MYSVNKKIWLPLQSMAMSIALNLSFNSSFALALDEKELKKVVAEIEFMKHDPETVAVAEEMEKQLQDAILKGEFNDPQPTEDANKEEDIEELVKLKNKMAKDGILTQKDQASIITILEQKSEGKLTDEQANKLFEGIFSNYAPKALEKMGFNETDEIPLDTSGEDSYSRSNFEKSKQILEKLYGKEAAEKMAADFEYREAFAFGVTPEELKAKMIAEGKTPQEIEATLKSLKQYRKDNQIADEQDADWTPFESARQESHERAIWETEHIRDIPRREHENRLPNNEGRRGDSSSHHGNELP